MVTQELIDKAVKENLIKLNNNVKTLVGYVDKTTFETDICGRIDLEFTWEKEETICIPIMLKQIKILNIVRKIYKLLVRQSVR